MVLILNLISDIPFLLWPQDLLGWLGLGILSLILVSLIYRWRRYHAPFSRLHYAILAILALSVPITSLFLGVRLPPGTALPPPWLAIEPIGPALMILAAVPWILAAGILGPAPAAVLAGISGLLIGIWDTHSPFTPLEYAILGVCFSAAVRQRYRTPFYRILRHPIATALLISSIYPLLFLIDSLFIAPGSFLVRFDYAINGVWMTSMAMAIQILIAGVVAELIAYGWPKLWGAQTPLLASPAETSLETRASYAFAFLILILAIVLMIGDWFVAGNVARQIISQRMQDVAVLGAESIPVFLETGQNLILRSSEDDAMMDLSGQALTQSLAEELMNSGYFRQLTLLDRTGKTVGGYPEVDYDPLSVSLEEKQGINLALQGVGFQYYTTPPTNTGEAAQISFIAPIGDKESGVDGVLIGRTDLSTNLLTDTILRKLDNLAGIGGQGILVDEDGKILYHPVSNLIMTQYTGRRSEQGEFFYDTAPDGTRNLVYYQPISGRPWALILTVSARQVQQLAFNIAAPLMGLLLLLATLIFLALRPGVRVLTRSLRRLSVEANRIAQGDLDHSLREGGVDEVGQLSEAFDKMRSTLRDRLGEINQLLYVSQGVASSLDMETAVRPILDSAMINGTSAAFIVIPPFVLMDQDDDNPTTFSTGPASVRYAYLNNQILELAEQQDHVHLTNPARARALKVDPEKGLPGSLFAISLRHENVSYGVLWTAHEEPHPYTEDEQVFLSTLAGQAALAASNAHLFLSAEIGRQRLEAILESNPDPVLVTDHRGNLSRANSAALEILGRDIVPREGLPVVEAITQPQLVELLVAGGNETRSAEFTLHDGRHFYATVSTVSADGRLVGRVCVFQDITRFKELAKLKSEIVENVSHDLRNPITHVKGYATLIGSVGNLNSQQTDYLDKILQEMERMNRKVTNLLDLSRLEAGGGIRVETVSLEHVIKMVIESFQLQIARRRHNIVVDISSHMTTGIQADPDLIQQAISNLVENAIKYTPPKGLITIRLIEKNSNVVIEVSDNGSGIAPVDLPKLFERYNRVGGPEGFRRHGTGLGLAIVQSIAQKHGGRVWVDSQLGEGSRFYLELPIRQSKIGFSPIPKPDLA